jgi:hypothetical protein
MKFSQTGLPRSAARSIVPPPTRGTTSDFAGLPIPKLAISSEAAGSLDPGSPTPLGLGLAWPDGLALGLGARLGRALGLGLRLGLGLTRTVGGGVSGVLAANATIPAIRTTATIRPARSPARMARRGDIVAEHTGAVDGRSQPDQYESVRGGSPKGLLA